MKGKQINWVMAHMCVQSHVRKLIYAIKIIKESNVGRRCLLFTLWKCFWIKQSFRRQSIYSWYITRCIKVIVGCTMHIPLDFLRKGLFIHYVSIFLGFWGTHVLALKTGLDISIENLNYSQPQSDYFSQFCGSLVQCFTLLFPKSSKYLNYSRLFSLE